MQMYYYISSLKDKGKKLCTIHVIRGTKKCRKTIGYYLQEKSKVTKHM